MNTGVQRSGATPPAARTANTKPVGERARQRLRPGQERAADRDGARDPLRRHATVAELRDLEYKVERAMEFRGARYLHVFVPCPLGWGSASQRHDPDRAAGQGDRALPGLRGRARRGRRRLEDPPAGAGRGVPEAAAPLRAPVRRPAAHRRDRADPGDRRPQHRALRAARRRRARAPTCPGRRPTAGLAADYPREAARARGGEQPDAAARTNPHGARSDGRSPSRSRSTSARASPTRPAAGAPSAPVYVDRLPPCNHACPAGENIQAWLYEAEEGGERLRARLAQDHGGQPVPGDHGPGLLPPLRDRLQPRPARRGGRHQLGRALPRRRGDQAGLDGRRRPPSPSGKRVLVVGAGPSGLSAAYHLTPPRPRGDDPRGRADGRRDDALRDPQVPAAARRARRRGRSGSSTWASSSS